MRTVITTRSRARLRHLLILAGALAISGIPATAQTFQFSSQCAQASDAILGFKFQEAVRLLEKEQQARPGNLLPEYYRNYMDFLVLFTGEDKVRFEALKPAMSHRIDLLQRGDRNSPYYRFCLAEVNLQSAFIRVKFSEYTTAALEFRKAYELLKENQKLFPEFLPNQSGLGLLHTLIGVIPENYRWLANLLGFQGSVEEGMIELSRVADYRGDDPFCRSMVPYTCVLAALIDANLRKDKQSALAMIHRFQTDPQLIPYVQSPPVIYARASVSLRTGRNEDALAALSGYEPSTAEVPFWFLSYLDGMAHLNDLDTLARGMFRTFLHNFTGINYLKSSWQKIGWTYLLSGDTIRYRDAMKMALSAGSREVDEDKQAFSEAHSGQIPAVPLLRARLLFDGGYYARALDELLDVSLKEYIRNKRDLAEYYYRLGRIYHETGQLEKAERNYRLAISTGAKLPEYFAAGAALQLGLIYENGGYPDRADSCYKLCLSMPFEEYRASLSQKARAGMERTRELH